MNNKRQIKNRGFTIVEALVAIFILTVSVSSMLGVTANSISSARYANNEITANYLLQEAIDSIRNTRDTIVFQEKTTTDRWPIFRSKYNICFNTYGCDIKMENFDPTNTTNIDLISCSSSGCEPFYYDDTDTANFFYSHNSSLTKKSNFRRTIIMKDIGSNGDQVKVTATVYWIDGTSEKSQSLETYLLNWQK